MTDDTLSRPDPEPPRAGDQAALWDAAVALRPGWAPHGQWQPAPSPWPAPSPQPTTGAPQRTGLRRTLGGAGAAALGLLKYGALLLKVGKLGPMFLSMGLSILIFAKLFGLSFGVGLVGLILVHEMGHVIAAKLEHVPASLPFFLGPFGALILIKKPARDARQDAVIGIGGPLLGTAGALACVGLAGAAPPGHLHNLLLALAFFGFFLNLFNLTPALPFDGGRVAGAVSVWFNVVGVVVMAGLILLPGTGVGSNPFLVVLLVLGIITTVQRFRTRHTSDFYRSVPPRTRLLIGLSWAALIAITALGMNLSHRALIDAGTIDRPAALSTQATNQA